jgi:hypothetical protein
MLEECDNHRRLEIREVQPGRCLATLLVDEAEKEAEASPVSHHGVRAGVALLREPVGEEGLQGGRDHGHARPSS